MGIENKLVFGLSTVLVVLATHNALRTCDTLNYLKKYESQLLYLPKKYEMWKSESEFIQSVNDIALKSTKSELMLSLSGAATGLIFAFAAASASREKYK